MMQAERIGHAARLATVLPFPLTSPNVTLPAPILLASYNGVLASARRFAARHGAASVGMLIRTG